jgi:dolichyl-phosphate beta-glucosyltransferase
MLENLSIIIPCYNEESRIIDCVHDLFLNLKDCENVEVIFVNDGSKDLTEHTLYTLINRYIKYNIFKVISYKENKGKGYAVKLGIKNSKYKYICFLDCDLSVDIEELKKLWVFKEDGLIIASREMIDSKRIPNQSFFRMLIGRIYSLIVRFYLNIDIIDQQCGGKLAEREIMQNLIMHQKIEKFSFDTEWLYICKKLNYNVKEIGIIWQNNRDSRVNIMKDSWRMLNDIIKIKKYHKNL